MRNEYDFSKAERGKFFRPNAALRLPVYLEDDVQSALAEKAHDRGVDLDRLVNDLLKKEIALAEG